MTNIACNLYQLLHMLYITQDFMPFCVCLSLTRYDTVPLCAVWFELNVFCNEQIIQCGCSNKINVMNGFCCTVQPCEYSLAREEQTIFQIALQ